MNRLLALGLTAALALPLAACGGEQTWQVVAVHTDPAEPGALLADAAGLANFTITDSSLTGTTACADLDAAITTEDDEGPGLDVYYDQTAPAVADWTKVHQPALERARAMLIVCTPGLRSELSG